MRAIIFEARLGYAPKNLVELDFGVPDVHAPPRNRKVLKPDNKTVESVVKTHQPYRRGVPYRNVIYILRDPRDVISSYFRYKQRFNKMGEDEFEGFATACICMAIWPGSWFEHLSSWRFFEAEHGDKIKIFRYEDLVDRNRQEIMRLGDSLQLGSEIDLADIFKKYDLEAMRMLEKSGNRLSESQGGFIGRGGASPKKRDCVNTVINKHAPHWRELMTELSYGQSSL